MPLSAAKRKAKRDDAKRLENILNPPKFQKRKCRNCPKFFNVTRPYNNPPQAFCSDECRKQFEHFGCAFGPLKGKLEKVVLQMTAEALRRAAELEMRITKLEKFLGQSPRLTGIDDR